MTSMRTLNRRLLRQQRYAVSTGWTSDWSGLIHSRVPSSWPSDEVLVRKTARRNRVPLGLIRAAAAVDDEQERRFWAETAEVWLGGPDGEAALIADVLDRPHSGHVHISMSDGDRG